VSLGVGLVGARLDRSYRRRRTAPRPAGPQAFPAGVELVMATVSTHVSLPGYHISTRCNPSPTRSRSRAIWTSYPNVAVRRGLPRSNEGVIPSIESRREALSIRSGVHMPRSAGRCTGFQPPSERARRRAARCRMLAIRVARVAEAASR